MGDKALAKRAMLEAKVPCIPGYQGEDQSEETLCREAEAMGMPVMIKAAAGAAVVACGVWETRSTVAIHWSCSRRG